MISKIDAVMAVGGIFVHSQKWVVVIASMPVHPLVSSVLMMLLARLLVRGVLPLGRKWLGGDLRLAMPVVVLMSGLGAVFLLLQSAINTWSFWLVVILQEMNAAFKNLPRLTTARSYSYSAGQDPLRRCALCRSGHGPG